MSKDNTTPGPGDPRGLQRRRRRRWFWGTFPVALVVLLAGLAAIALPAGSSWANRAFDRSQHATAMTVWGWLSKQKVVDPWKAPFGEGTAALADSAYSQAIQRLSEAYVLAPAVPEDVASLPAGTLVPRCDIQHNLALAYEGEADAQVLSAQEAVTASQTADDPSADLDSARAFYDLAIKGYENARTTRTRDGCSDDATAAQREQDKQDAAQTARDKLDESADQPDATAPTPDEDDESTPDSQQPDDPDSTGDSDTDDNNPSDSPSSEPSDEPGQQSDPSASATPSPSESLDPAEKRRQEELQERQRQAQEQTEQLQQGSAGGGTGKKW